MDRQWAQTPMYGVWAPCKFFFSFFFCLLTILSSFLDYNYRVTTGQIPLCQRQQQPRTTTTTATGRRRRPCTCHTPLRAPARRVVNGSRQRGSSAMSQPPQTTTTWCCRHVTTATNLDNNEYGCCHVTTAYHQCRRQ
jgi:hypothetical protein